MGWDLTIFKMLINPMVALYTYICTRKKTCIAMCTCIDIHVHVHVHQIHEFDVYYAVYLHEIHGIFVY
jgi:hypothetical protein